MNKYLHRHAQVREQQDAVRENDASHKARVSADGRGPFTDSDRNGSIVTLRGLLGRYLVDTCTLILQDLKDA